MLFDESTFQLLFNPEWKMMSEDDTVQAAVLDALFHTTTSAR
jgi:hypothetical protein